MWQKGKCIYLCPSAPITPFLTVGGWPKGGGSWKGENEEGESEEGEEGGGHDGGEQREA